LDDHASHHSIPLGAVSVALSIIAIAVLLTLLVASLRLRHQTRTSDRQEAESRAHVGDAQRDDSLRRRAEVRGAAAERAGTIASPPDE
jgi:hypothetical protein